MRIDDLSAPSGRFVARDSASVATVDRCPGRGRFLPAADNDYLRSLPYPSRLARTHWRAATAASAAPPAVDYGFGPGGAPRPSARRANTPLRIRRPRPGPHTAATPAPAASSVPTAQIPSDRDRAEPVGTLSFGFTPPLGDTPLAPAKLDALGDAAKL